MKDYYNILGIKKNATFYDITEAYRELSVKYHPDNHGGDEAYAEKYNDVQEAYNTLSNGIKRREYDNYIIHLEKTVKDKNADAIPAIEYFRTDKAEFEYGEEVTFSWKTLNADKVTLVPFGAVQPVGSYSEKIKNFKNKLLSYELLAENTLNGRESKASVSIKNKNFDELYNHFKKEVESQYQPTPVQTPREIEPKGIEKDHLPYMPKSNKIKSEKERDLIGKPNQQYEKQTEHKPVTAKVKKQEVKRSEESETDILLYIVILFLVVGISILIYLGFFM